MSDAELDPHVLISARARANPKLIELASDRARWGWIVLLGEAKLIRPPGRFASRRALDAVLGEYRRYVPDYIRVGLLHVAPEMCDECLACLGVVRVGMVVVHDWRKHQERVSRTTEWRRQHGIPSGHTSLTGETAGKRTGNDGEISPSRAPVAAHSQSQSDTSSTEEGVQGEEPEFAALQWLAANGCYVRPGNGYHQRLVVIVENHGIDGLLAEFERLRKAGVHRGDIKGYLFGAEDALNAASRPRLDNGADERRAVRSQRIDEQMWRRRVEQYRYTGAWDDTWGPVPEPVG